LTIETVIERAVRNAEERLGWATIPATAYAVAIVSHDPDELAAANIVVGLEPARLRGGRSRRTEPRSPTPSSSRPKRPPSRS
jgi:hypothetical protein